MESAIRNPTKFELPEKINLRRDFATDDVEPKRKSRMPSLLKRALLILLLVPLAAAVVATTFTNFNRPSTPSLREQNAFRKILNTLEPAALHQILREHLKGTAQDGPVDGDEEVLVTLHRENKRMASHLVELAKRQGTAAGNSTTDSSTTTATATTTTKSTPPSTTTTSSSVPPTTTTTTKSVPPTTTTSSSVSSTTESKSSDTKTTKSTTTEKTKSTSSESKSTASSSNTGSSTSTDTSQPTSTHKTSSVTTTVIYTTTDAAGGVSLVTSTKVVPAPSSTGGSDSGNGQPATLQSSGASSLRLGDLWRGLGMAAVALPLGVWIVVG